MPVRTFLAAAKRQLQDSIKNQTYTSFVIGNESADLDSITSALVYGYIQSSKIEAKRTGRLIIPIANLPASDLPLRTELTALLKYAGIKPSDLITLDDLGVNPLPLDKTDWVLVDHNALQGQLGEQYRSRVVGVIDHHEDDQAVPKDAALRIIEKCGSCNSLVTNSQRETWQSLGSMVSTSVVGLAQDDILIDDFAYASTWDGQVAKLSLGAILIDTGNMEIDSKVTDHDRKAVRYLEAKINVSPKLGKDYDRGRFFTEIHDAKMDIDSLSLDDILRKDYKEWKEGDLTLGMSSVVQSYAYLQGRKEDLQAALKSFAQKKSLNIYVITTSGTEDSGHFYKEILLTAMGGEKATRAVDRFVEIAKDDLKLEDRIGVQWSTPSDSDISFQHLWNQGNVKASRKQVAPFLRKAMAGE